MDAGAAGLRGLARAAWLAIGLAGAAAAQPPPEARQLYRFVDENGVPVYTDRRPDASQPFEAAPLRVGPEPARVSLYQRVAEDQSVRLVARNEYHAPVELTFELLVMRNLDASTPSNGTLVVPARAEREMLTLRRADVSKQMQLEYEFRYMPGDPSARHASDRPYRLPYALARAFLVAQAHPDTITHSDPASRHAVDFDMPVGTGVYAARGGIVIDVADDFFESGTDRERDVSRANIVRVLHADGTMALYAHLNWNSIRVAPGQRVARGEYLADSGNTGFSTGPHLHFVVQRNRGGGLVSVPVVFEGSGGAELSLSRGDRPTAY